jgi:hypothetical protein
MSRPDVTAAGIGRDVLGPIVAEFCLRLWSLGSLLQRPDDAALLFCARGGLRLQLAYERFLAASGLPAPLPASPLMVSRVVAVRPALLRTVIEDRADLLPAAATALSYEFRRATLAETALAVSGVAPTPSPRWDLPFRPDGFATLLGHPDGKEAVAALAEQVELFGEHLRTQLDGRRHAVLVDTGLFGTTRHLLAEGMPDILFSSALVARSYRPGTGATGSRTFGLSVHATDYSPARRRTALLRYWHFVEWLFEPELPSVRAFSRDGATVRANLETPGWPQRIQPTAGTTFAGVLDYLDALGPAPAERVLADADRAWDELRRAIVWPRPEHAAALVTGARSHDFGTDRTWTEPAGRGPIVVLRGSSMWREGEIARSRSPLRRPLLLAIETAYGARQLKRRLVSRFRAR